MIFIEDLRSKQALYSQYGEDCSLLRAALTDGTLAVLLYRGQEWLSKRGLNIVAMLPHWLNKVLNGCVIGVKARFGPGLVLIHPVGIVINSSVRGGIRVWIESGVVIGDNRGRSPVLGNHIFLGSGAKVIGGVSLGDGSKVGANAVVLSDVPPGVNVVGIPARPVGARAGDQAATDDRA